MASLQDLQAFWNSVVVSGSHVRSIPDPVLNTWIRCTQNLLDRVGVESPDTLMKALEQMLCPFFSRQHYHLATSVPIGCFLGETQAKLRRLLTLGAKLLILANRSQFAYGVCKANTPVYPLSVLLRVSLINRASVALWILRTKPSDAAWATEFVKTGEEKAFVATIIDVHYLREGPKHSIHLEYRCSACTHSAYLSCDLLKLPTDSFYCPQCLATLRLDGEQTRKMGLSLFQRLLLSMPTDARGYVSAENADAILQFARCIRPIVLIRFGKVHSSRIGHFLENTAIYLYRKAARILPESVDLIGFDSSGIANSFVWQLWQRVLPSTSQIGTQLADLLPAESEHNLFYDLYWYGTMLYPAAEHIFPIKLPFTKAEVAECQGRLQAMGVKPGAKYVCLHVRSSHHFKGASGSLDSVRNADVETYFKACRYLMDRGYYVLRLGDPQLPPLPPMGERLIDYAVRYRTEMMDIFLAATCEFMIGSGSGIDGLPELLGRKSLWTNEIAFVPSDVRRHSKILRKHYFYRKEQRFLAPMEAADHIGTLPAPLNPEVQIVDNSEDEILDATMEMCEIIEGNRPLIEPAVPPEYGQFSRVYLKRYGLIS